MAQLPRPMQLRHGDILDLQAGELGMQADHRTAGDEHPDVLVGEATEQRELA